MNNRWWSSMPRPAAPGRRCWFSMNGWHDHVSCDPRPNAWHAGKPAPAARHHSPAFTSPPPKTLPQAHIFLFLIALIQIVYACVSMLMCLWKVRRCTVKVGGVQGGWYASLAQ